jgi:hypothetical protein
MTMLRVFVPNPDTDRALIIDPGSGIVSADDTGADRVTVDYEGNRFESAQMAAYADRVDHAAGRHTTRYPTVARASLPTDALIEVATYDDETGTVTPLSPTHAATLAQWCGADDLDDTELTTQSNGKHNRERMFAPYLASPDPALRRFAASRLGHPTR